MLILISVGMHVGWNLLGKRNHPSAGFFLLANGAGVLGLLPVLGAFGRALPRFPATVWGWLIATGLFQTLYYAGLAGAYRAGDMSVAYPLARSAPVVMVALINVLLGRADQIGVPAWVGMLLIVAGGLLLPLRRLGELSPENYLRPTVGLALLAAVGTAGYSLIDDHALRVLRAVPDLPVDDTAATLLFAFWEAVTSCFWLGLWVLTSASRRAELHSVWHTQKGAAALAGVGIYLAYVLVLMAMGFVRNVGYVVAFRQLSVPLGALMGMWMFKEPPYGLKLAGVGLVFAGLVLVGTG